mmetsp:Transcript_1602/g.2309  ORF Transcript_1602/g.2309 Transcript_1602/m.2309 type:complete len:213 (+) Transcript_1602:610-1248(+)
MSKPVLLEKSPPNAIISRFLQALINLNVQPHVSPAAIAKGGLSSVLRKGEGGGRSMRESVSKGNDVVRFLFITRHPLANALAHRAWPFCRQMPLDRIVANWVKVNEYMLQDMDHLRHVKLIKMEDFQRDPDRYLRDVYEWIGLDPDRANRTTLVHQNTNQKYKKTYCKWLRKNHDKHAQLEAVFGDRIRSVGYDIREWSQCGAINSSEEQGK